ncbi:MAG: protein-tyrosine-phosphatase [Pirellulaceae bacterium]|nr:MAG: protein-tyrosine-phosphatase [Pirellulaceae bacterium]
MPPIVLDLQRTDDVRDAIHLAVQALVEGKLVVFPTETAYAVGASALRPDAVQQLRAWKCATVRPLSLAVKSLEEALDYVPDFPEVGRRVARRCWPGPIKLVVDDCHPESAVSAFAAPVREALKPQQTLALRVPAHDVVREVMRLVPGPIVWTGARRAGEPQAYTAADAVRQLAALAPLVLDAGRCKFSQPTSVVRVRDHELEVLREGVLTANALRQLSSFLIVLVCTGNTCRSPMAEVMLKAMLSRQLGVSADQLSDQGILVVSAGTSALAGAGPAAEAVAVMAQRGLDLSRHEAQPLSDRLVRFADLILTMTEGHRRSILQQWPSAAGRVHLLSRENQEIADPIGGPLEQYQQCASQIEQCLKPWVDALKVQPVQIRVRTADSPPS